MMKKMESQQLYADEKGYIKFYLKDNGGGFYF